MQWPPPARFIPWSATWSPALGLERPERHDLIDSDVLKRELAALARAGNNPSRLRAEALALVKEAFVHARERVRERFESGRINGVTASRVLSDLQDATIQILYDFAITHFHPAQESERLAILATGGYGRRQLAPYSDVDLLFLRYEQPNQSGEAIIAFVLQMLWDLGLKVGHATRTLQQCIDLAKQDRTICTSLLEARHIWGERQLSDHLRKRFRAEVSERTGPAYVSAKLAERDQRHFKQGESRYLVEPNIKDGKGGLRDLQTLYWVGKYLYGVDDAAELIHHHVFTREEYDSFRRAEAFLWDVRFHLHYVAGRPEERLTFAVQPELSRRFGLGEENSRHAVERFMRRYFLVAKDVGDLTRIFCAALEEQNKKSRPSLSRLLPGFLKARTGNDDFFVENGRLNAKPDAFSRDPKNLLRIFQIADAKGVDVHPAAMRTITRSLGLITDELRSDAEANALFLAILTSKRDPERALRWLNESGVFGRLVPEFGRVVALTQFNMYHHYTVDEHLIRVVGNVAAIERGELKSDHPLATDVAKRITQRNALYAAMLLHDIAKGLPGDHSGEGARISERLCPRWGLSPEETRTVAWLVENHLVMSDTAQRRDIADPQTVRDFVGKVQSPELLRLLLILTVADIRAVGPGVWNGWKGQLLRELYHEAEALMAGESSASRPALVEEEKSVLATRLTDFTAVEIEQALSRHSDHYWLSLEAPAHEWHARLLREAALKGQTLVVEGESNDFQSVTEIVIAAPDRAGLFFQLAGAITGSGGSIVDAKIFTTSDRLALDIFSVQDSEGGPFGDRYRIERLRKTIQSILDGQSSPRDLLARTRYTARTNAFDVRPCVHCDNAASAAATVIEVEAADRPGLLYDVTRAMFECGLSISSAMIATYGERAIDVFYVRDSHGSKVTHPELIARIETRLLEAIRGEAPAPNGSS
ncbi:MAG TPA: [protein-PII] uridylyltransferase [Rhizomicrobium sp.]